jgi:hypothetical protein
LVVLFCVKGSSCSSHFSVTFSLALLGAALVAIFCPPALGVQSLRGRERGDMYKERKKKMTPLQNEPQQHQREAKNRKSRPARRETEPGVGFSAKFAAEIKSRFSYVSTQIRFHEQLRWGHHGGGTNAHPGPAKPQPVYYRNIIENPLSLALLGECVLAACMSLHE